MRFKLFFFLILLLMIIPARIFSQNQGLMFGDQTLGKMNYYDISNKYRPSIEVKAWGAVKNPGFYRVTPGTDIVDFITYTGGLSEAAELDDIRIVRLKNDTLNITEDKIIPIDYESLFDDKKTEKVFKPVLMDGDIVVVPAASTSSWFSTLIQVVSLLSSLTTLVYVIIRLK